MIDIFVPSYHRPDNIKTAKFFIKKGYPAEKIHIVIDSEADDKLEYEESTNKLGCNLHVFDMEEARARFDYVHRPSISRRSAGQARNMFYEIAESLGIEVYCVIDDDTSNFEIRPYSIYWRKAELDDIVNVFDAVKDFVVKRKIGMFGLSQTGDMFQVPHLNVIRNKVMNTTFINTKYIYRGERGIQDDDTSQFVGVMNEGLFTGSLASGLVLSQTQSAKQKGGLTDLYNENKLLNKSLVTPIQFPTAIYAEKQQKNGGRLHHKINARYLYPKLIKGKRNNIAWDTYPEDYPFTNEPRNENRTNRT
jgi:hypothetical protein